MRAVILALLTAAIVALAAILAASVAPPSTGALGIARRIARLVEKPGLHEVYVPGVLEFRDGKVVVEVAGERAEASTPVTLEPGSAQGYVVIFSDGERARLLNP